MNFERWLWKRYMRTGNLRYSATHSLWKHVDRWWAEATGFERATAWIAFWLVCALSGLGLGELIGGWGSYDGRMG